MQNYLTVMHQILTRGRRKPDRTGTGTLSLFSPPELHFDLSKGFPIVTTKKVNWMSVVRELQWMLRGQTNVKDLHPVKIWDPWADSNGDLGPTYGKQWRAWSRPAISSAALDEHADTSREIFWQRIDQMTQLVSSLIHNPASRRMVVTNWNVGQLDRMLLPPCHILFQANVNFDDNDDPIDVDVKMYQRSADWFLGVPFNISQYALLTHILAACANLKPGRLIMTFGDAHLYLNHIEQAKLQLSRHPHDINVELKLPDTYDDEPSIDFYANANPQAFKLKGYSSHPAIKAEIAV